MITITNLSVAAENSPIIHDFSLHMAAGSLHGLMGPNGSGKSSLAYALIGHPTYSITAGSVVMQGMPIHELSPDKRAQAGLFLAFQQPLEIPGLTIGTF